MTNFRIVKGTALYTSDFYGDMPTVPLSPVTGTVLLLNVNSPSTLTTDSSGLNQTVINVQSFAGALKHTSPCIYYIVKNGTLAGSPNFSAYSSSTCGLWDTAATTVTWSDNSQLLYTFHLGDTGEIDHNFTNTEFNGDEFTIQPGEWITVAAKAVTGTPSYVTGSLNTREDQ